MTACVLQRELQKKVPELGASGPSASLLADSFHIPGRLGGCSAVFVWQGETCGLPRGMRAAGAALPLPPCQHRSSGVLCCIANQQH